MRDYLQTLRLRANPNPRRPPAVDVTGRILRPAIRDVKRKAGRRWSKPSGRLL